ncbi:MAG: Z1 domain-containing protein [Deltaproteobacteria bacterium]|jgi:hypothetical protein|nr:Z1 domain-containing protein [Deltaproteobacteria bacterium]
MYDPTTQEKFVNIIMTVYSDRYSVPEYTEVSKLVRKLAESLNFTGSPDFVIDTVLKRFDTKMSLGVSLVNQDADHDEQWVGKRNIVLVYSEAYKQYLKHKNWSPAVISAIDKSTHKILGHLQDPHSDGKWDRRGLVIGQVQSGKTANYLGLVTKAADAGYKFIIIIAGIHNSLRQQTQQRVEDGFIGRSSNQQRKNKATGVGELAIQRGETEHPYPVTLTTEDEDFNKRTANQSGWKINDFSKPLVVVIKKNVTTLNNLLKWLKELNAKGDGTIEDVPLLMVDDEADNASINTNNSETDPTKTNSLLRRILATFSKSSYVGYTATPFANIFINPDANVLNIGDDLFPRDFIYWLDAPSTYFGPDKVFIDDDYSSRILVEIQDAEHFVPLKHNKHFNFQNGLPPSLHEAINVFILSRAIREVREQGKFHASMLVNVSRFTKVQQEARNIIRDYVQNLKNAIQLNYKLSTDEARKNNDLACLEDIFIKFFKARHNEPLTESWESVKGALFTAVDSIDILLINSGSDELLDYDGYNVGRTVLAVGGVSLSRGLTLEGLCTSYMYRNTRMYDTLMQMGRWFGYRDGYDDICTVWLNGQSINWYNHIAVATDDLRQQIVIMRQKKCNPRDFGLYVRNSADSLMITAPGKMKDGVNVTMRWNLSGQLRESYLLPHDVKTNCFNRQLIKDYLETGCSLGANNVEQACPGGVTANSKGWIVRDVPLQEMDKFLRQFIVCPELGVLKTAVLDFLEIISSRYDSGDVLFISLEANKPYGDEYPLGYQLRRNKSGNYNDDVWRLTKNRVASRNDEKLGLTNDQIHLAESNASSDGRKASDADYRTVRDKPLLMLHLINCDEKNDMLNNMAPAFSVSFPRGEFDKSVDVVVNQIWLQQMKEDFGDYDNTGFDDE